jgi:hypothetical protein
MTDKMLSILRKKIKQTGPKSYHLCGTAPEILYLSQYLTNLSDYQKMCIKDLQKKCENGKIQMHNFSFTLNQIKKEFKKNKIV